MSKLSLSEVLRGAPIAWPKPQELDIMRHIEKTGATIIYEDAHVVAFEEDDDEREAPKAEGEHRITVAPKKEMASLMDFNVTDEATAAHLLFAIQQVAFKLGLHEHGFEVRANVLPPYQRRPHLRFQIRTGPPKKSKPEQAASSAVGGPTSR
jgi:hypothetical protein